MLERLESKGLIIRRVPMPGRIRGQVIQLDQELQINVNNDHTEVANWLGLLHELTHKERRHFELLLPVEQVEQDCRDSIDPAMLIEEDEDDIDPAG